MKKVLAGIVCFACAGLGVLYALIMSVCGALHLGLIKREDDGSSNGDSSEE